MWSTQLKKSNSILCTSLRESGLDWSGMTVLLKNLIRLFSNNNRDIASPNDSVIELALLNLSLATPSLWECFQVVGQSFRTCLSG